MLHVNLDGSGEKNSRPVILMLIRWLYCCLLICPLWLEIPCINFGFLHSGFHVVQRAGVICICQGEAEVRPGWLFGDSWLYKIMWELLDTYRREFCFLSFSCIQKKKNLTVCAIQTGHFPVTLKIVDCLFFTVMFCCCWYYCLNLTVLLYMVGIESIFVASNPVSMPAFAVPRLNHSAHALHICLATWGVVKHPIGLVQEQLVRDTKTMQKGRTRSHSRSITSPVYGPLQLIVIELLPAPVLDLHGHEPRMTNGTGHTFACDLKVIHHYKQGN